jgi:hypothetical protein
VRKHWTTSRAGAAPARCGSATAPPTSSQLDIYGEALDAIYHADSRSLGPAHQGWTALTRIIDWVCEHWDQPEEGICIGHGADHRHHPSTDENNDPAAPPAQRAQLLPHAPQPWRGWPVIIPKG